MARTRKAKLIFNHTAGNQQQSAQQLVDILLALQTQHIEAEVYLVHPKLDVAALVRRAQQDGTRLIVVAGGDGTVDSVAHHMVGTTLRLGIIPIGTRNNLALNLNIPSDIKAAAKLLRKGKPLRIDVGKARSGRQTRYFLELLTAGLLSDMYELTDELQHGDMTRFGEWLATFMTAEPSQAQLTLDDAHKVGASGHMVLVANMPYIGPNMQLDPKVKYRDGKLDVFVFSDMTKLHLVSFALRSLAGNVDQQSMQHFQVRQLKLRSKPAMSIMADGLELGRGMVKIEVVPKALTVIAGPKTRKKK